MTKTAAITCRNAINLSCAARFLSTGTKAEISDPDPHPEAHRASTIVPVRSLGLAGACLLAFSACVADGEWFTPAGVPLGEIECTSPAPLNGASGREICLARVIDETPDEIARCTRDGGKTQPVSTVDRRFACNYRISASADADGSDEATKRND